MEKAGWIYFAFLALQLLSSFSHDTSKWLSIDCGNDQISFQNLLLWDTDSDYIQVGSNKVISRKATRNEFNTLRAFPDNSRNNCYTVPTEKQLQKIRYIIRVGFYYGNYDGLSKPPTFNLFINNILWKTINTSINNGEPFYEEIIYQNKESGFFKICVVQIKDGGIPFINSIETMVVFDELYPKMETDATYNLVTRINLGGPEFRYDIGSDEIYNRIWSKKAMPYASASGFPDFPPTPENHPPIIVLRDGIEFNASDPMILTINLSQSTPQSAYIVLYVTNLSDLLTPNKSARVKIEINDQDQGTIDALYYGQTTVVTKYPVSVSGPAINIKLSPADETSLPPMIAAMEVFTKWGSDKSAAASQYFSFAYSFIILFMLLTVA